MPCPTVIALRVAWIAFTAAAFSVEASELAESKDLRLSHALAFSRTIAARSVPEVYEVKVIVEDFYGDCSNPGPDCPSQELYVSVVEDGIQPRLFVLGKAVRWTFAKWLKFPTELPKIEDAAEFEVRGKYVRGSTFATKVLRVHVESGRVSVREQ